MSDLELTESGFYEASDDITFPASTTDYMAEVTAQVTPFEDFTYMVTAEVLVKGKPHPPPATIDKIVFTLTIQNVSINYSYELSGWNMDTDPPYAESFSVSDSTAEMDIYIGDDFGWCYSGFNRQYSYDWTPGHDFPPTNAVWNSATLHNDYEDDGTNSEYTANEINSSSSKITITNPVLGKVYILSIMGDISTNNPDNPLSGSWDIICNAKFYSGNNLIHEYNKEFTYSGDYTSDTLDESWLSFNTTTQVITEL